MFVVFFLRNCIRFKRGELWTALVFNLIGEKWKQTKTNIKVVCLNIFFKIGFFFFFSVHQRSTSVIFDSEKTAFRQDIRVKKKKNLLNTPCSADPGRRRRRTGDVHTEDNSRQKQRKHRRRRCKESCRTELSSFDSMTKKNTL